MFPFGLGAHKVGGLSVRSTTQLKSPAKNDHVFLCGAADWCKIANICLSRVVEGCPPPAIRVLLRGPTRTGVRKATAPRDANGSAGVAAPPGN